MRCGYAAIVPKKSRCRGEGGGKNEEFLGYAFSSLPQSPLAVINGRNDTT